MEHQFVRRMTTAVLCDDEPLMRANLRDHLQSLWPELQIVGEAENGPAALREIAKLKPDIAFLDIQMPGLTGLQVAQLVDQQRRWSSSLRLTGMRWKLSTPTQWTTCSSR